MSSTFDRLTRGENIKYIEGASNFERYFSRYDIQEQRYEAPARYDKKNPYENKWRGGAPLSWNMESDCVYADHADNHTLIIGPTASGKSRLCIMPMVRMLGVAGESMIISDPKAEIYHRTAGFLKEKEYTVRMLNLREPAHGNFWNPLAIPYQLYLQGDIDRAYEFINDTAMNLTGMGMSEKDPFWDNSAGALFAGLTMLLFKYCRDFRQPEDVVHIGSVLYLRNILCFGDILQIQRNPLWNYAKSDLYISSALIGTLETANDTRAGILSVFDQKMRIFSTQPGLLNMLSRHEPMYDDMDGRPTALFLVMPDEKTTYHGLASLFIKQSYEYLIYKAQKYSENRDVRLKIRLNYVLDEFSSLPTVKDFPAMITAARSRNIRFHIVIQSKHQLNLKYGDDTDTILANCTNWIFLTGRELKFLQEISALCGEKTSGGFRVPVISVADLQRFDKRRGEALILSGRFKPYLTRLPDISAYGSNHWKSESDYIHEPVMVEMPDINMEELTKWMRGENVRAVAEGSAPPYLLRDIDQSWEPIPRIRDIDGRLTEEALNYMLADIDKKLEELEKEEEDENQRDVENLPETDLDCMMADIDEKMKESEKEEAVQKREEVKRREASEKRRREREQLVSQLM